MSWCDPENPRKTLPQGPLIGEILFAPRSSLLTEPDKKEIAKLASILKTHRQGMAKTKLLLLGDIGPNDGPRADWQLGQKRAESVAANLTSILPAPASNNVEIDAAAKFAPPLTKRPPGAVLRPVVEIINKGPAIQKALPPTVPAKSDKEAFAKALVAWNTIDQKEHPTAVKRISHWINFQGRISLMRGNDGYFSAVNPTVRRQAAAGSKKLPPAEWQTLLNHNKILRELKQVAGDASPNEIVAARLLAIDAAIEGGITFLLENVIRTGAGGKSEGFMQMIRYMLSKPDDWFPSPIPFKTEKHGDIFSFYAAYFS